ncbi:hypothetical protein EG329_014143 [Mollisiaceae sp. DMI_Dod_QoI]|nr:hypothetical protein EG329_014143 [Helotiales sp. DMI_Dod_QoI]
MFDDMASTWATATSTISKQSSSISVPTHILGHFSQSQLAIALTISKSKPEGLSTKDYIQQLRKHVKTGQPVPRNELRYIDTAEFWKDQFTRLHQEKKELEDKVHCLEEAQRQSRKRHHEDSEYETIQAGQEGPSMFNSTRNKSPEDWEMTTLIDDDYLRVHSYAVRIGRQRTSLETNSIDPSNLDKINAHSEQTLQLLVLLETALPDCCVPLKLLRDINENSKISFALQRVMNQITLAFLTCLTSVDNLCQTIPGRTKKAEIVYRIVMIFKHGLGLLQTINHDQATHETMCQGQGPRTKRQRTEQPEFLVNMHLTNALATIAHNAQWKITQPAHSEILEGLLFSILEHTGRLVSEAVFGEPVADSDHAGNITEDGEKVVQDFVKPEARYIVQVLHAMTSDRQRSNLISEMLTVGKMSRNAPPGVMESNPPDLSGDLLSKAKKILQSTLVKGAVGGAELESLRLPIPPKEMTDVGTGSGIRKYGKDWLIEMVWGLIGWDMICSK